MIDKDGEKAKEIAEKYKFFGDSVSSKPAAARNAVLLSCLELDCYIRMQPYFDELLHNSVDKRESDPDRENVIVTFRQKATKDSLVTIYKVYEALRVDELFDGLLLSADTLQNAKDIVKDILTTIDSESDRPSWRQLRNSINVHASFFTPAQMMDSRTKIKHEDIVVFFDKLQKLGSILLQGGHPHPQDQQKTAMVDF